MTTTTNRIPETLAHLAVPIDSLSPYPGNARRGNIDLICDSLAQHGQFRPIIVRKGTHQILAGFHTWKAAERLGWDQIAAQAIDVDDDQAARIVLVDNKASDNGTYDDVALLDFLAGLPDLNGTGWDDEDLQRMRMELEDNDLDDLTKPEKEPKTPGEDLIDGRPNKVTVGEYSLSLSDTLVRPWSEKLVDDNDLELAAVIRDLRTRLVLPEPPAKPKPLPGSKHWTNAEEKERKRQRTIRLGALRKEGNAIPEVLDAEKVDINSISTHPNNPRRGDVNTLAESLLANGQYRPVVVNRRTNFIVGGNHTWKVAKALGWDQIAVTWIDVDSEEESRILLVDNRAADLSTYDTEALLSLVSAVGAGAGTGFDDYDLDAMIYESERQAESAALKANPPRPDVKVKVLTWLFEVTADDYDTWAEQMKAAYGEDEGLICAGIATRLGIDLT